jgi:cytochrome c-type biogenesis protein CcmH
MFTLPALLLALSLSLAPAAGAQAAATTPAPAPDPTAAPAAAAVSAPVARPTADDPVLEKRLIELTKELRCMVCQNESIADSHAPLAVDMRNEIREQLRNGMSDREVIEFMVARYGNFVRFRPPLDLTTIALWFGPALLMVIGLFVLVRQLKRRSSAPQGSSGTLSAGDQATLAALARQKNDE